MNANKHRSRLAAVALLCAAVGTGGCAPSTDLPDYVAGGGEDDGGELIMLGSKSDPTTCDAAARLCVKTDSGATSAFIGQACAIDANCRAEGTAFDNVVCGADGRCTYQPAANECQTNAECTQRAGGQLSLCRRPDLRCVPVQSDDCAPGEPLDAFQDPNAIVLGTLLTNRGEYVESGLPLQNAVELAAREIRDNVRGLPGGPNGTRRPLAFVFCHEGDDAVRAARHLTDQLRVPAIIGASISDFTIDVANNVTIPSGVLLLSPAATKYLYFVATGAGRHTFSETLEAHNEAIRKPR